MFKSWRSEKKKIKVVFKLQFQATQVPRLKKSALMISLVPEDVGKPTLRLEKVAIQDGTCSWENPVYETVKLIKQTKTGKLNEKIYHFIVSTGSSKAGFLGEASLDFADFATETEPLTVSLPLKFANSGAVLHVTIQKMQEAKDQRGIGENGDLTVTQGNGFKNQQSNYSTDGKNQNFGEDEHLNITSQNAEQIGGLRASTGSRATLASCWDISSEQNTQHELGFKDTTIDRDPASFQSALRQNSMPQNGTVDAIKTKKPSHRRSKTDWSVGSASDGSLVDSNSLEDNLPREWQESSDNSIEKLKNENTILLRQAELSDLELQSLRKQIVKESRRAQDLSRQTSNLKEERDALRTECEELKWLQKSTDDTEVDNQLRFENENLTILLEEVRRELNYEKEVNTNLQLQLQKTQDSNSELMLAVKELNEMLEQKNREVSCLSSVETSKSVEAAHEINSEGNMPQDEDQRVGEEMAKRLDDAKEVDLLKQEIVDLYEEIEFHMKHREELEMHIKQVTRDYDVLKQENHYISSELEQNQVQESLKTQNECLEYLAAIKQLESHTERLEEKIKQQSHEYSESLVAINELESQVKELKNQLEKQAQGFEDDLDAMICAKTEQEQRAIRAEEALRKTRWKNAITAERLQEEFKRLSVEMASKFDENEKLATKALTEANELREQKRILEQMLQKANEELGLIKDQNEVKRQELQNQIDLKAKQTEQMSVELNNKSRQLEYAQKHEEEKHEAFSMEIQTLRTEIEKLTREKYELSEQAEQKAKLRDETEQMKTSIGKTEMPTQRWNKEKNDLEKKFASAKKEAEKAQEELIIVRSLKDEKEMMIENLHSEVDGLRVQCNEWKHGLIEEKMEKENLRKQLFQLKHELQKEDENSSIEKVLKNNSGQGAVSDVKMTSNNNNTTLLPCDSKEVASLKEKLRLIKEQVKLKEVALETSANSVLGKEKNLSIMMEELESSLERLKDCQSFCADQFQKEATCTGSITTNFNESAERGTIGENLLHSSMSVTEGKSVQEEVRAAQFERKVETCSEKELKAPTSHSINEGNLTELLTEMAFLKKRNKSMESELREMQERYSEISLKFAEVEGERQQLVMTVRNLKNGKKN